MRNKKGHRYIVPYQGPPEPAQNTQAAPRTGALTLCDSVLSKLAVLVETPQVQWTFKLFFQFSFFFSPSMNYEQRTMNLS
jgi:hypothetical protein